MDRNGGVDALIRHREFFPAAAEYGPVFRAQFEYGAAARAEDYAQGQKLRQHTAGRLANIFTDVDAMLCPAAPGPAMPQADFPPQRGAAPQDIPALVRFAGPFHFAGNPSITVPNGFNDAGLPLAMQFIGRDGDEATLVRAAAAYEAATDWHCWRPLAGGLGNRRCGETAGTGLMTAAAGPRRGTE